MSTRTDAVPESLIAWGIRVQRREQYGTPAGLAQRLHQEDESATEGEDGAAAIAGAVWERLYPTEEDAHWQSETDTMRDQPRRHAAYRR